MKETKQAKKVKIVYCNAQGEEFKNLQPGSIHEIVVPPEEHKHLRGVWVMGKTEPVRLLFNEFEFIS